MNKITLTFVLAALFAIGGSALAIATSTFTTEADEKIPARVQLKTVGDLEALRSTSAFDAAQTKSRNELVAQLAADPSSSGSLGKVVAASARPFKLPDNNGFLWVAQTSNESVCVFVPQHGEGMSGGFSAACNPLADFNAGGIVGLTNGKDGKSLAYSVQGTGVGPATLKRPDGSTSQIPIDRGVSVALLRAGEAFKSGGLTVAADDLAATNTPTK